MRGHRFVTIICIGCIVLCAVFSCPAQAQRGENEISLLTSTGLPTGQAPENILPAGAIGYARVNNVQVLLENIDSLLTSIVPEKALPPQVEPFFQNPQPVISFLTAQAFGRPVASQKLPGVTGIGVNRPVSLAVYPMPQGFVVSVPVANPTIVTGMVQGMLRPRSLEEGAIGDVGYYRVRPSNRDFPPEIYVLTSEDTAFFCGNFEVVQMLVNSDNMGTLAQNPVIATALTKYADRDLAVVVSPGMFHAQIPAFQQQFSQALTPIFYQIREAVKQLPPAQRMMFDARLRLEFGIEDVEQLVEYAEAYATGIYRVLLAGAAEVLTDLDGLALSLNIEETFQTVALTVFSQAVQTEKFSQSLPLADLKKALHALPGNKSSFLALGQAPQAESSEFLLNVLDAVEQELTQRGLPMDAFMALKSYQQAKQPCPVMESRVPWTLKTFLLNSPGIDLSQFDSPWEVVRYVRTVLAGGPFLIPFTMMPDVEEGAIEQLFAERAKVSTDNAQQYQAMREDLPLRSPLFAHSSRFSAEEEEQGQKLVFENIYTTRRGFFGYQEHELINRRILFHTQKGDYEVLYPAGADTGLMHSMIDAPSHPVPEAVGKLLDYAPEGTIGISQFRVLYLVENLLNLMTGMEQVMRRELETFLEDVQELVDEYGEEQIDTWMLEAGLDLPLFIKSLHVDEEGQVYAMLPGGLHYPRPRVMPKVKELFADFLESSSHVGGSASFVSVRAGELEFSFVQSMEALALLVKSVGNTTFEHYIATPDAMELLVEDFGHPLDFQDRSNDSIFEHPVWEDFVAEEAIPLLAAIHRSKRSRTIADMRAIGTALGSHLVDTNYFPPQETETEMRNVELPDIYYKGTYSDGWNHPFYYVSDESGSQYMLISYGKDGDVGVSRSWFDEDLVFMNGQFVAPEILAWSDPQEALNEALIQAVREDAFEFAEIVLDVGADPNVTDEEGQSALSIAYELEHDDMAELLLEFGAEDVSEE